MDEDPAPDVDDVSDEDPAQDKDQPEKDDDPEPADEDEQTEKFQSFSQSGITFEWKKNETLLEIILAAPTTGWVAAGFNPSSGMKDANFIMCWVDDAGEAKCEDHFGTELFKHALDTSIGGQQNVTVVEGTQNQGETTVRFIIPLNSGDSKDQVLEPGKTYPLILSYGATDNTSQQHTVRAKTQFTL